MSSNTSVDNEMQNIGASDTILDKNAEIGVKMEEHRSTDELTYTDKQRLSGNTFGIEITANNSDPNDTKIEGTGDRTKRIDKVSLSSTPMDHTWRDIHMNEENDVRRCDKTAKTDFSQESCNVIQMTEVPIEKDNASSQNCEALLKTTLQPTHNHVPSHREHDKNQDIADPCVKALLCMDRRKTWDKAKRPNTDSACQDDRSVINTLDNVVKGMAEQQMSSIKDPIDKISFINNIGHKITIIREDISKTANLNIAEADSSLSALNSNQSISSYKSESRRTRSGARSRTRFANGIHVGKALHQHASIISVQPIAFSAYLRKSLRKTVIGDVIPFTGVLTNEGKAYHRHESVFVCPKSGMYMFTWKLYSAEGTCARACLRVNGQKKRLIRSIREEEGNSNEEKDNHEFVRLEDGDHVWMTLYAGRAKFRSRRTKFAGIFLSD